MLAICCTPYQLLVAAQVLYAYYPDCQADLIVTDQMSGSRKVFEACRDSGSAQLASAVETAGAVAALFCALPLMTALLDTVEGLL